jgi:DNA primase
LATVSTPVTWDEIASGLEIEDFRLDNVRERFVRLGDLWAPMKAQTGRLDLTRFMPATDAAPKKKRKA